MKKLTILLLLFIPLVSNAQKEEPVYFVVENMPEFPGEQRALDSFVKANLNMPEEAIEADAEGRVFVEFIVEVDGKMSNIKIAKDGVGYGCGEEALRVTRLMSEAYTWEPGKQSGKRVRVMYRLPIVISQEEERYKGVAPRYPEGRTRLDIKFWDEFILPGEIAALEVYGRIEIELFISKEGKLLDAKILKDGVGFGLAEESLRAIKVVAKDVQWIPGRINGKPVDMRYIHVANIVPVRDYVYCAEPDNPPSSMLGDEELKRKILKKVLKRYELAPDESQQELIIDIMITESGTIEYIHITHNSFDNKLAMRARGALYPEQSRFIAGTLDGVNVRSRYRMVITRQDIIDFMNHVDHE